MSRLAAMIGTTVALSFHSLKVQMGALKMYFILTAIIFALLNYWVGGLSPEGFSFSLVEWVLISFLFIIPATLVTSDLGKEKELRTLSTLLIAPVSRASILMGKLMAEAVVWGIYIVYLLALTRALMPEALEELSFEALSNFFIMFWALGVALGSIGLLSAVTSKTASGAESSSKLAVFIAGLMTALGYVLLKAEVEPLASILLYPSPFSYAIDGAMYPLLGIGPAFDVLALFGFTLLFLFISASSFEKQDVF